MSYLNPLLAFGFDKLAGTAARAGVCGFIIPDLPYDEGEDFAMRWSPMVSR
jgi:tryptophan synthase alpha chain